ncbi:aminodeoxychorismate lyase [Shouchella sp. 1P09AA]|uniref:aminodeoxychorismate lyase n=1 Tax=unclassified Shouchella TaxID=2893065 RepID=UPI0039A22C0D
MYISVNGREVRDIDAVISPYDHGFLYGLGLFETFAVREDNVLLLNKHVNRLNESAKELGIQYVLSEDKVMNTVRKLLNKNNMSEAYVRWNVSAGIREIGLYNEEFTSPQEIVYVKELPRSSISAKSLQSLQLNRNTVEGERRYKSHHYLNNLLAKKELGNQADTEGLFYTKEGYVAEGIVSNVFFVKGGVVCTPALETGILNGVTRQYTIDWCNKHNQTVVEGLFTKEDLLKADEVFLTNAIQGIVPVETFDELNKYQADLTLKLLEDYRQAAHMQEEIEGE